MGTYLLLIGTFVCFSIHRMRVEWLIRIATIGVECRGQCLPSCCLSRSYRSEFNICWKRNKVKVESQAKIAQERDV
jgi:hypothetical protein